jgi:hypothetical protein
MPSFPSSVNETTERQVAAQLHGMRCASYEVGIIASQGVDLPKERIRTWPAATVIKSIPFLRARNAAGYNIFIRPAPLPNGMAEPLAFIDDLNADSVERMKFYGHRFAALIESSPANFQGWIRLGQHPVERRLLTAAASLLAKSFYGDTHSADWRHFGRLAGFTNRKQSRLRHDGSAPFAVLRDDYNGCMPSGRLTLQTAADELRVEDATRAFQSRLKAGRSAPLQASHGSDRAFLEAWRRAGQVKADGTPDGSARDFSACLSLLRSGYDREAVVSALALSPGLAERHALPEDYVRRTVDRAVQVIEGGPRP